MKKEKQTKKSFKLKGEMYIDTLIGMMITFIVIALGLSILPVLIGQYMLSAEVHDLARDIAIVGEYDGSTITVNGKAIQPTVKPENPTEEQYNGYKYQLGTEFTVTAEYEFNINIGGIASVDIPLSAKATGRSETYWKEMDLNQK